MIFQYRLDFICDDCGETHEMSMNFMLADGPPEASTLAVAFPDGELPPQVALFASTPVLCPKTDREIEPADMTKILLVPQQGSRY